MAGFLNLHCSERAAKRVAEYNVQNGIGEQSFVDYLIPNAPSIFMSLTSTIVAKADGKGGASETSDDSELKTLKRH